MGRQHAQSSNRLPSWRRAKQLDAFKNKPVEVQEAAMFDDPTLSTVPVADTKAFLTVSETDVVNVKRSLGKFTRNKVRCVLDNDLDLDNEPKATSSHTISHDEFIAMVTKSFAYARSERIMATLGRCVTLIAGWNANRGQVVVEQQVLVLSPFDPRPR